MLKEIIKKIPPLNYLAKKTHSLLSRKIKFTTSSEYWESRYKKGGNSGPGSYDQLAEFKAEVINRFTIENDIEDVIEYGCGDGNQLKYFDLKSSLGFDISKTTIQSCRKLFINDKTKRFELLSNYKGENADLTMSLDVIFHLVEDEIFNSYMEQLFSSSKKYVVIYSSNDERLNTHTAPHVRHREFTKWVHTNKAGFKMLKHIPNKFPFNAENEQTSFADFYFFKRTNEFIAT